MHSRTTKILLNPALKKPATNFDFQTLTPDPPPYPASVQRAKKRKHCKSYTTWIKPKVNDRWHFLLSSSVSAHVSQVDHSDLPLTSRAQAYHRIRFHAPKANLFQLPYYLTQQQCWVICIDALICIRTRSSRNALKHSHYYESGCNATNYSQHMPQSYEETSNDNYHKRLCNYCHTAMGLPLAVFLGCGIRAAGA